MVAKYIFENVLVLVNKLEIKLLECIPGSPEYIAKCFKEQADNDERFRREGISGSPEYVAKGLREAARRKAAEKKDNILMK